MDAFVLECEDENIIPIKNSIKSLKRCKSIKKLRCYSRKGSRVTQEDSCSEEYE